MIVLHQPGPALGIANASPFCMKVEAFLKLNGIPYKSKTAMPSQGPMKKVPFIQDGGEQIADSSQICDFLSIKYQLSMDEHLTQEQKAVGHSLQRMVEESLYWVLVYSRWVEPDSWPILREQFFGKMPTWLKLFVPVLVRKQIIKNLYGQGSGRFPSDKLYARAEKDLEAISTFLGDKPFLFGDRLSSYDIAIWAGLSSIIDAKITTPLTQKAIGYANLKGYCEKINHLIDQVTYTQAAWKCGEQQVEK